MGETLGSSPEEMGIEPEKTQIEDSSEVREAGAIEKQREFQERCDVLEETYFHRKKLSKEGRNFMLSEVVETADLEARRAGVQKPRIEIYEDVLHRLFTTDKRYGITGGSPEAIRAIDTTGKFETPTRGPRLGMTKEEADKLSQNAITGSQKSEIATVQRCTEKMRDVIREMREELPVSDDKKKEIASFGI
ncbi:MAG: hypothetical protein ABH837_00025 [bacterium]